jgi:hypothetical protein
MKTPDSCLVWLDAALYGPDDDKEDEFDDHACRRYAQEQDLIVVRTLITSKRWQRPPLCVLRDQLRADDVWIVVVPSIGHINLTQARTFAEIHSASGGAVYTREPFPDLGLDSIKGTGQDVTDQ